MATIAVRVGREVKEISGLTNRTTCWDVVLALLKERQNLPGMESSTGGANSAGGQGTEESTSSSSVSKSIKELAQSYVIVENWRGCEKPIPPRTRILNVWQAWGKEQRHVELSLKKSKHIRYRDGNNNGNGRHGSSSQDSTAVQDDGATAHLSLHRLSQHQKRRIRRNLMQYQRAVMMRDEIYESDDLRNNENNENSNEGANRRVLFNDAQPKCDTVAEPEKCEPKNSEKRNGVSLSEEKFVDGIVTGPECLIKRADRAQLISQGNFNREFCKYRRRNHRRRSSVDGVVESRHHRRRHVPHYPYSSHHFRRRSSRHRSKNHKSGSYRYSTDDTTSTTTTTNTSEDENAEDADDEKSVLIEFSCPVPRRSHQYNVGIGGCNYGGSCAPATITDSSTTTSGDSMTSSIGCSTSSETSSGGDYFSTDPLSLFPSKRVTFAASPLQNTQTLKNVNSTNNKPKKSKSLLGGLPKPALNLIESFRRSNLKRKSSKKTNNQTASKSETQSQGGINSDKGPTNTPKTTDTILSKAVPENDGDKSKNVSKTESCVNNEDNKIDDASQGKSDTADQCEEKDDKETTVEDNQDDEELDQLAQVVISQNNILENQQRRLAETDIQIEQIENDIHKLRTRALGKNYVQDTYLSGLTDAEPNLANSLDSLQSSSSSSPVLSPWLVGCDNVEVLEQYIKDCDKIVEMQIKIEQYQRKSEIILQEMQEEVWRVSTNTSTKHGQDFSPVSKAAALMLGLNDEDEASDDEMRHEELSVTNCSFDANEKCAKNTGTDEQKSNEMRSFDTLELEISRTELEASLYLSLRLAAELEEVEQRLRTSETLVQKKGENLIQCVRDMAVSEEGIEPDAWNEYGELLNAYDVEVQERIYLDMLERAQMAEMKAKASEDWNDTEDTHYIDATSPNPTSHLISDQQKQQLNLPSTPRTQPSEKVKGQVLDSSSMNQALSPCVWCEHCKIEENNKRAESANADSYHVHHHNHPPHVQHQPPKLFSELPLPRPVTTKKHGMPSAITPGLLPMLPLPDGLMSSPRYDSDYEDLPDMSQTKISETDKDRPEKRSGKDPEPVRDMGIRPNALPSDVQDCSSNNTDDSGNASAGSTSSFASSDGSRNSSCDGGSPRPLPSAMDSQGSNSLFGRNGVLRGSWKGHFVFPSHAKQNSFQSVSSSHSTHGKPSQSSKQKLPPPPPPPPASAKPSLRRPDLPPKPSMTHKQGIKELEQHEILMQQQKLIRRNSGGRKKNYSVNHPAARYKNPPIGQDTEKFQTGAINSKFAPRGGSFKNSVPRGQNETLLNPCDKSRSQFSNPPARNCISSVKQHSASQIKSVPSEHSMRANSNYDNDSDTGRSSLHSVDSDPIMCSETLV